MKIYRNAVSGLPVPPGVTLREEITERGITQTAFAKQIGQPIQMVNEIIKGKKSITAELWLKLEASYQISKARAALRKTPRRLVKILS